MGQQAEVLREETQSLKELQENSIKLVKKKLSKTIQDINTEVETTKYHEWRQIWTSNPWKDLRSHGCKYQEENTRDRRENLMC